MSKERKTLARILNTTEAAKLQEIIVAKGNSPVLDELDDPEKATRFARVNLRGSYLFARFAVPAFASSVFGSLVRFPPVDDTLGKLVLHLTQAVMGEICNNLIFLRPDECHSHYYDALEAYQAAGGDMAAVTIFTEMVPRFGLDKAMAMSGMWSPGSRRYASNLLECCQDPLAMFILMPANEELAPRVYARALDKLSREKRFDKFRQFLDRHVELDESDHGPITLEWLETYIEKAGPKPAAIKTATEKVLAYFSGGRTDA